MIPLRAQHHQRRHQALPLQEGRPQSKSSVTGGGFRQRGNPSRETKHSTIQRWTEEVQQQEDR